ncbi:winged helix-turn-helix domain-containing protein [Rhizobium leguminosarum]|jgi:two-component system response regulator AdeR|uniref:winged helix-turn-helix domain-containing protein n=2 Tax=Rhizobium TaxID=379 RepID=UPI003F9A48A9
MSNGLRRRGTASSAAREGDKLDQRETNHLTNDGIKMSFDEKTVRVGVVPKFKLTIDHYAHAVWVDHATGSKGLNLTRMEFRLLDCMARHPTRMYERDELIAYCCPDSDTLHRTIDSHISNLRSKLDAVGARCMLVTVWGRGYKLNVETCVYFVSPRD